MRPAVVCEHRKRDLTPTAPTATTTPETTMLPLWLWAVLGVVGLLLWVGITSEPAPTMTTTPSVVTSSDTGNPVHDRLIAATENERARVFSDISGGECPRVTRTFFAGMSSADKTAFWNTRCANGKSYQVSVNANATGSTQVLDCDVLRWWRSWNASARWPTNAEDS